MNEEPRQETQHRQRNPFKRKRFQDADLQGFSPFSDYTTKAVCLELTAQLPKKQQQLQNLDASTLCPVLDTIVKMQ